MTEVTVVRPRMKQVPHSRTCICEIIY